MKKEDIEFLHISHFDYILPDNKIAKYPLSNRDSSKLLLYEASNIQAKQFFDLVDLLPRDSLLIFNNTRVIHARLIFRKSTGAFIEVFCLAPHSPLDYQLNFATRQNCSWSCMIGNAKKWKEEIISMEIEIDGKIVTLNAERQNNKIGNTIVSFKWDNSNYTFSELLDSAGMLPIPPYLNRPAETSDDETYQTLYSKVEGSVAAPTAGLHFTPEMLKKLDKKGIKTAEVTLHVGAGTFKPVKSDTMGGHEMHDEFISVSKKTIEEIILNKGKLIVVGTTSMRTIESLYYIGKKIIEFPENRLSKLSVKQWEPYEEVDFVPPVDSIINILDFLNRTNKDHLIASTGLLIAPGYKFHYPDALITNFHQPQSTLLLLVSAFVGDDWRNIYNYALNNDFRFLSYGDSSLLWKNSK